MEFILIDADEMSEEEFYEIFKRAEAGECELEFEFDPNVKDGDVLYFGDTLIIG